MVEDVYEPLARYRDEFRARHAALVRAKFDALVRASGVDVVANRRLVAAVRALEKKAESVRTRRTVLAVLAALAFVGAVVCGVLAHAARSRELPVCIIGVALTVALGVMLLVWRSNLGKELAGFERRIADGKARAQRQMEPLVRLFTWETPVKLVEETVPRLAFDPYFTAQRLEDLRGLSGWSDAFNDGRSVLCSQSGVINGNPFVFADCLVAGWGEKTYHGSLEISWLEEEEDDEGRTRLVRRHETLHASVTKPCPEYTRDKLLIYGNDAAPNLAFSRRPTGLSGEKSWWKSWKKRRARKRLEAFSQNLDDDSNYTMMANQEFETLFQTMDRTNEVEYRLLFSALAQRQMLELIEDRQVGFGDDFTFLKRRKINMVRAEHLDGANLDTDPAQFAHWSYDRIAETFRTFNEKFFKDVYFAFAPILSIPLYQQTRPHADIWRGVVPDSPSSFWEHEALANYHGEDAFRPASCVTRCLLKTEVLDRTADGARVAVTAHGYRTEDRVDYVSVWGGDGRCHEVPVVWDEYLPVSRTREMVLSERETPADDFRAAFDQASASVFRRSIRSYL